MKNLRSFMVVLLLLVMTTVIMAQRDEIKPGDTVEGKVSSGTEAYDFTGEAGTWVVITLESEDFDPLLIVEDSDGNEVARDDDSGGSSNARLLLPVTGNDVYTIKVTSFGGDSEGNFVLRLNNVDITALEPGEQIDDQFDDESVRFFQFDGKAGDTYNIVLTTNEDDSLDTRMLLKSPEGVDVATDDDSGGSLDPYLRRLTLSEDGKYVLQITTVSGEPISGDFSLLLEPTEALVLSSTPLTVTLDEDLGLEVMTFPVEKSGTYRITVSAESGDSSGFSNSFSVDLRQNDSSVAYLSATGVRSSLDFDVSETGTLIVNLSAYVYESTDYEITVTSAE